MAAMNSAQETALHFSAIDQFDPEREREREREQEREGKWNFFFLKNRQSNK